MPFEPLPASDLFSDDLPNDMKKDTTPKALLSAARKVPAPAEKKNLLSEYGEVIDVLKYDKMKTWQQVADWLTRRGVKCTKHTVVAAHREWEKQTGRTPEQRYADEDTDDSENALDQAQPPDQNQPSNT